VTAAHCVEGRSWFEVIAGAHDPYTQEPGQVRQYVEFADVTIHENYNFPGFLDNDIAIMYLRTALPMNGTLSELAKSSWTPKISGYPRYDRLGGFTLTLILKVCFHIRTNVT
jgi:secreted trypsin-like serine protease